MKEFTIDRSSGANTTRGSGVSEWALPCTSLMKNVASAAYKVFSAGLKFGLLGSSILQATQTAAQTTVVPDFRVNTITSGYQGLPSITSLGTGGFAVAWEGLGISCQIYDAIGNEEGNEGRLNVNTITTSYQGQVDLAELIGGGFAGVWNEAYDISGGAFNNSLVPVTPQSIINTVTLYEQGAPNVVCFNDSSLFMVWHGGQAGKSDISGRWYNSSIVAQGDEVRINEVTSGDQMYPTAAVLKDNTLVVGWYGKQTGNNDIYGRIYNSTFGDGGPEFVFNTVRTGNQQYPKMAPLKGGGFVMVWMSDHNGDYDIYFRAYSGANRPMTTGEVRANSDTAGDQTTPDVDGLDGGGFVIVWATRNPTTGDVDIAGRRFNSFGNPQQSQFSVNTDTTGVQMNPVVTGLKFGGFVVVWEGAQSGDYDVYGKKFDAGANQVINYPPPPTLPTSSSSRYSTQAVTTQSVAGSAPAPTSNQATMSSAPAPTSNPAIMSSAPVSNPSPLSNGPTPASTPTEHPSSSDFYSAGKILKALSFVYLKA